MLEMIRCCTVAFQDLWLRSSTLHEIRQLQGRNAAGSSCPDLTRLFRPAPAKSCQGEQIALLWTQQTLCGRFYAHTLPVGSSFDLTKSKGSLLSRLGFSVTKLPPLLRAKTVRWAGWHSQFQMCYSQVSRWER